MEASRAAPVKGKKGPLSNDVALSHIRKLYAVEKAANELSDTERYRVRQAKSLPLLNAFKTWLKKNTSKVLKGSLSRKAMDYTLNQWDTLVGYCERWRSEDQQCRCRERHPSFALGQKAWLFADTAQGAKASATCYSLIETAKANGLEPSAYIHHVLTHIADAVTLEQLETLLP